MLTCILLCAEYGGGGRGYSWGAYQEGSGYFGPFLLCAYTPGGWGSACDGSVRFKKEGEPVTACWNILPILNVKYVNIVTFIIKFILFSKQGTDILRIVKEDYLISKFMYILDVLFSVH